MPILTENKKTFMAIWNRDFAPYGTGLYPKDIEAWWDRFQKNKMALRERLGFKRKLFEFEGISDYKVNSAGLISLMNGYMYDFYNANYTIFSNLHIPTYEVGGIKFSKWILNEVKRLALSDTVKADIQKQISILMEEWKKAEVRKDFIVAIDTTALSFVSIGLPKWFDINSCWNHKDDIPRPQQQYKYYAALLPMSMLFYIYQKDGKDIAGLPKPSNNKKMCGRGIITIEDGENKNIYISNSLVPYHLEGCFSKLPAFFAKLLLGLDKSDISSSQNTTAYVFKTDTRETQYYLQGHFRLDTCVANKNSELTKKIHTVHEKTNWFNHKIEPIEFIGPLVEKK